jgi:hypothetical protein
MEKSKKANECRKILNFGERVAKLPRIKNVADQICNLRSEKRNCKTSKFIVRNEVEGIPRIGNVEDNYARNY